MHITIIGVVGAGSMGHGIAQVFAQAGYDVRLNDVSIEFVKKGIKRIEENLSRAIEKGKLNEIQKRQIESKLNPTPDLADFGDCQFVVETAMEKIEVKSDLFRRLDGICSKECVLATNTSSIPITYLAGL